MKKELYLLVSFCLLSTLWSCSDDDVPPAENEEEVINEVVLTFTPPAGGQTITATYLDDDGDGVNEPVISPINLLAETTYNLSISFRNTLEEIPEDITEEVREEGDEHQIFFSWSADVFTSPTGLGNIGSNGSVNYTDEDANGNPIGLETTWTTGTTSSANTFRVILKHQPGIKSATSTSENGETDIDITFSFNIN